MTTKAAPKLRLRHEHKHIISQADALLLSHRLSQLFPRDSNADSHGLYRVSSLYFDTPSDRALREKLDGVSGREKFRLRYYGSDLDSIRLEKKYKLAGLCGKRSAKLTPQQAQQLLQGDIAFLLQSQDPLLQELYSKMKGQGLAPKTIVTYDREAFLFAPGNVRITLDRNLRSGLRSLDFLDPQLCHTPVSEGMTVLEVKYDDFLPELVRMAVQVGDRKAQAYSKYAVCRRYD